MNTFIKYFRIDILKILILYFFILQHFSACDDSNTKISKSVHSIKKTKPQYNYKTVIDSSLELQCDLEKFNLDSIYFDYDSEIDNTILTFRGGNQRNSPTRGKLQNTPKSIELLWEFKTAIDSIHGKWGYWGGGAGWTGQPLIVTWTGKELKLLKDLYPFTYTLQDTLIEIIQVSLSGYIYFIDLKTGRATRPPLIIHNPIKGTPSISPDKNYLLVGQGIPHNDGFYWRCFNLKTSELIYKERTPSKFAYRYWGASDASPLISNTNTFLWPNESGIIYRGKINNDSVSSLLKFRYKMQTANNQGIESSPAAIGNLVYASDNGGNLICFNVNTMKPRWHFFNSDDSDASPVITLEQDTPYVYIGNEVDKQGEIGIAACRKIHGLTGKLIWEYKKTCHSIIGKKTNNGGILSTVCVGKNNLSSYVWAIFSITNPFGQGTLVCLNSKTGKVIYEIIMPYYSWASPLLLKNNYNSAFIYYSDVSGSIVIMDAKDGKTICTLKTGKIIESSPVAWNNYIIQPARGNSIMCLKIN